MTRGWGHSRVAANWHLAARFRLETQRSLWPKSGLRPELPFVLPAPSVSNASVTCRSEERHAERRHFLGAGAVVALTWLLWSPGEEYIDDDEPSDEDER